MAAEINDLHIAWWLINLGADIHRVYRMRGMKAFDIARSSKNRRDWLLLEEAARFASPWK